MKDLLSRALSLNQDEQINKRLPPFLSLSLSRHQFFTPNQNITPLFFYSFRLSTCRFRFSLSDSHSPHNNKTLYLFPLTHTHKLLNPNNMEHVIIQSSLSTSYSHSHHIFSSFISLSNLTAYYTILCSLTSNNLTSSSFIIFLPTHKTTYEVYKKHITDSLYKKLREVGTASSKKNNKS